MSIKFDGEAFAGAVSCDGAGLSSKEKEKNGKERRKEFLEPRACVKFPETTNKLKDAL